MVLIRSHHHLLVLQQTKKKTVSRKAFRKKSSQSVHRVQSRTPPVHATRARVCVTARVSACNRAMT